MAFSLTPKQAELTAKAASRARHILAYGGGRSGKTFGFCRCIAVRGLSSPRSRHLICRLHHNDVRLSVMLDTWPKMMSLAFPGVPYTVNKTDQMAILPDDVEVWFGGLDDKDRVDKILGREFATIYVNEASQVAYETVLTLRTRLAQACTKRDGRPLPLKMYYDLNPVGMSHWTYLEAIKNVRPDAQDVKIDPALWAHLVINPTDNPNLPSETLQEYANLPEKQRKRFFEGKYQSEVPGTLWPMDRIDALRVDAPPPLNRIVVGLDPSGSDGTGGDSQGIVIVGAGCDGHYYVLQDATCRETPAGWAAKTIYSYRVWGADLIVAEANFGGAMVESTIRGADLNVPVKIQHASRGKHVRAEPIAALYETRPQKPAIVHHVGRFPELEEQMGKMTTSGFQGAGSPDRVDALVWALTELALADEGHQFGFA
jgi:Uncharacterized conserved protein